MTRRILTIMLAAAPLLRAAGDIAPNPVQAKGIVSEGSVEIRMVRERVVVDLYRDSSVVECMFVLKNDGKSRMLNIGFPEMNFYHSRPVAGKVPDNFSVFENDRKVMMIEAYRPDGGVTNSMPGNQQDYLSEELLFSPSGSGDEKPWLLWDSHFEENEIKTVTVRYSLPYGVVKRDMCRYFNYLLSTGAGWKGNIEHAEIIVNLKDMDWGMVLQATPAGYAAEQNQIKWIMTDFEPTTSHDIKIYYEPVKGEYERLLVLNPDPAWFIDGKMVWDGGMFDDRSLNPIHLLHPDDIQSMSIQKGSQKDVYGYETVIFVTTKNRTIDRFVEKVTSDYPRLKSIEALPHPEFTKRYILEVDGVRFEDKKMLDKLSQIDFTGIMKVKAKRNDNGIVTIMIRTRKE
jgi:hypothetical protein